MHEGAVQHSRLELHLRLSGARRSISVSARHRMAICPVLGTALQQSGRGQTLSSTACYAAKLPHGGSSVPPHTKLAAHICVIDGCNV